MKKVEVRDVPYRMSHVLFLFSEDNSELPLMIIY